MSSDFRDIEWKMKDGKMIKLRDMSDSHLANCIRLVDSRIDDEDGWIGTLSGMFWDPDSMASYCAGQDMDSSMERRGALEDVGATLRLEMEYRREHKELLCQQTNAAKLIAKWQQKRAAQTR